MSEGDFQPGQALQKWIQTWPEPLKLLFTIVTATSAVWFGIVLIFGLPVWFVYYSGWSLWASLPVAALSCIGAIVYHSFKDKAW